MFKFLIGLGAVGGLAGTAAVITSVYKNGKNTKDEGEVSNIKNPVSSDSSPEVIKDDHKTTTYKPEVPPLKEEVKENFEGVLVFSRDLKGTGRGGKSTSIYIGKVFKNNEYKQKTEEWKKQNLDDGDPENNDEEEHIIIELTFGKAKKPEQELKEYLEGLNKKIAEKSNEGHLEKLEKSLQDDQSEFQKNFGEETYSELIEKIKKLKGN